MNHIQALEHFLQNAVTERQNSVNYAKTVLNNLNVDGIKIPLPKIKFKHDCIQFSWTTETHYLQLDLHRKNQVDWFFRNKVTTEVDGTDFGLESELSENFLKRFHSVFGL